MDNQLTFSRYAKRFGARLHREASAWARDNIAWGAIMLVAPAVVYVWRSRGSVVDWGLIKTTVIIYVLVFAVYLLIHGVRTVWKLDVEQCERARVAEDELAKERGARAVPKFKPEINLVITSVISPRSLVLMSARIINLGEPSAILNLALEYVTPTGTLTVQAANLLERAEFRYGPEAVAVYEPSEALINRSDVVIVKGGYLAGKIAFLFQEDVSAEVTGGVAVLTLLVSDYLGHVHRADPYTATSIITDHRNIFGEPTPKGTVGTSYKSPDITNPPVKAKRRR